MGRANREVRTRKIAYDPLPSQRRFHRSEARFKGFSGPIGSGKSQALCQEAIRLTYLNGGRTGLLGAPTYPMLRDATQAALSWVRAEAEHLWIDPRFFEQSDGEWRIGKQIRENPKAPWRAEGASSPHGKRLSSPEGVPRAARCHSASVGSRASLQRA